MFFSVPVYQSSVDFTDWFWLKRKSRKTFDVNVSTKICFFFNFAWGQGAVARHPLSSGAPEANISSATQSITRILWNLKFHVPVYKIPLLVPILSQINPLYTLPYSVLRSF